MFFIDESVKWTDCGDFSVGKIAEMSGGACREEHGRDGRTCGTDWRLAESQYAGTIPARIMVK